MCYCQTSLFILLGFLSLVTHSVSMSLTVCPSISLSQCIFVSLFLCPSRQFSFIISLFHFIPISSMLFSFSSVSLSVCLSVCPYLILLFSFHLVSISFRLIHASFLPLSVFMFFFVLVFVASKYISQFILFFLYSQCLFSFFFILLVVYLSLSLSALLHIF